MNMIVNINLISSFFSTQRENEKSIYGVFVLLLMLLVDEGSFCNFPLFFFFFLSHELIFDGS